jgi:hypothetical protein
MDYWESQAKRYTIRTASNERWYILQDEIESIPATPPNLL